MRKKLKDVCDFYSGTGFPTKYQGETEGEYPFYKVGDIANNATAGKIYLELCNNYISSDVAKKIKGCILPKDTVVFAKIGEALKLNRRAITSCDCLIDNNAMGIAPRLDLLRIQYFYFFMKRLKMQTLAESTTVPSVRKAVLEAYEIEVPSLAEQEEIEKKLALMQKIIKKRRQELSALDELVNARFVEMFGDIHNNEKGFEIVTIESVCTLIKDGTHQTPQYTDDNLEGYKFLSSKDVMSQKIDWTNIKYIPADLHEKLYAMIKPQKNDILMSKNGVNYGVAAVNDTDEIFDIYVSLALLRPKKIINPIFFRCAINSPETKRQFDSSIKGIGVPNLHLGEIKKTKIFLPPLSFQNQFADFVHQIDKSKLLAQIQLKNITILLEICSIIYTNTNGNGEGTI